jgi:hypothetical protein
VWLSPDPVLAEYMAGRINGGVYRPINLGLYTYAWNNPVVLIDPDGRLTTRAIAEAFVKSTAVVGTALSVPAAAAVAEPTPVGEIVVAGAFVVGSIGYAGYLIFDAAANGEPPKPPESFPIPEDTPEDVAAPPPAAGGGGAKDPPKPPAPPAAESPEPPKRPASGAAASRLPVPPTPGGMPLKDFGNLMRWGTGSDAARAQIPTLTREGLQRGGVTREIAEAWTKFYRNEMIRNPANPSAPGRAELMDAAAKILR